MTTTDIAKLRELLAKGNARSLDETVDLRIALYNALPALLDEIERLRAIVERTAAHFEGTDAPLGIDARAAIGSQS